MLLPVLSEIVDRPEEGSTALVTLFLQRGAPATTDTDKQSIALLPGRGYEVLSP